MCSQAATPGGSKQSESSQNIHYSKKKVANFSVIDIVVKKKKLSL